jgi:hypothetical protein
MGWFTDSEAPSSTPNPSSGGMKNQEDLDLDQLDEDDGPDSQPSSHVSGMGGRVSTMTGLDELAGQETNTKTFQDYAADGELSALESYLEANPGYNLNTRNSSVRTLLHADD